MLNTKRENERGHRKLSLAENWKNTTENVEAEVFAENQEGEHEKQVRLAQ